MAQSWKGLGSMLVGVVAGIVTGALWGLTFIAARAVLPYSAWDITVARYSLFGLMSLLLMVSPRFRPFGLSGRLIGLGFLLGALLYTGYFLTIAFAVDRAGPAIPPLIVGLMPIVLAVVGNLRDGSVPWRLLALPLTLIGIGVIVVNGGAIAAGTLGPGGDVLAGTAWALAALAIWVVFGAVNAAVMRGPAPPTPLRWTGVQGVGALVGSLVLLPMTHFADRAGLAQLVGTADGRRLLAWAAVMGIGGSWFAAWAWIVAAQRLPLAFAAQLVVFETVFGLLDGFLVEHRWPLATEWLGSLLQIAGVMLSIAIFTRPGRVAAPADRGSAVRVRI